MLYEIGEKKLEYCLQNETMSKRGILTFDSLSFENGGVIEASMTGTTKVFSFRCQSLRM